MADNEIKFEEIQRRGVDSAYSMMTVSFEHPEEGLIVGEAITQEIIRLLPDIVPVSDMDYRFFEGYLSRDGCPDSRFSANRKMA